MVGDGGWSWFGDPRAVFFAGRHRRTYVGWVSRDGRVMVASFDHGSRHIERFVLRRGVSVDDHHSPGLLMRADGRLTVFYTGPHREHMFYRRSQRGRRRQALGTRAQAAGQHSWHAGLHVSQSGVFERRKADVPVLARRAVVAGVLAPQ